MIVLRPPSRAFQEKAGDNSRHTEWRQPCLKLLLPCTTCSMSLLLLLVNSSTVSLTWSGRVIPPNKCICRQSTETAEWQQAGPLIDLYPGNSPAYLNHVLHDVCHNQLEVAHMQTCRCVAFSLTAPAMQHLGRVLICNLLTVRLPAQQLVGRANRVQQQPRICSAGRCSLADGSRGSCTV